MIRVKLAVGFAIVGWALAFAVAPAFAEFTSKNKESKGSVEVAEATLEAGGATVVCHAFEESLSKGTWTIKKGGEASTDGPDVLLNIAKWGSCTGRSSEISETKAEISECELEVAEPGEEASVKAKLVTACLIKISSCEVKLEPKENEKLTSVSLDASGSEDENLFLDPEVTNVATTVKGSCPGIKAGEKGVLKGELEAYQVQPAVLGDFTLSTDRPFVFAGSSTAVITIKRREGFTGKIGGINKIQPGAFTEEEPGWETCIRETYSVGQSCKFNLLYNSALGPANYSLNIWGGSGIVSQVVIRGR